MKVISRFFRMMRIQFILIRYNLDEFVLTVPWLTPLRFLMYFNPWYWLLKNKLSRGERIRLALENLGPIFVKAGQVLSTRRDILPDDIADELAKLQDRVPPFCGEQARAMIEKSLGQPIDTVFRHIDLTALASASIAQVHAAELLDGRSVVVKVLRPGIRKIIDRDIDLLLSMARFANRYAKNARRFKPVEMVEEIASTLHDELDLLREAANASQLRRNFQHSDYLYIPEIIWTYSRMNVLVMERIEGIPIHNITALRAAGINMKKLAERGVEIFFTQVFRDSFFHADMHPGNIFVDPTDPNNPRLIAVDFGIVGSLNTNDQRYLAENLLAFFKRDYQRVAELHIASGWLPKQTRIDQFEGVIRAVCEPIFERPLKDISFGQLLLRLFQAARQFHINIQPQLVLLQKTLLNIEGVGRQIDPDLDLWATAAPFLEKWLKKQVGVKAFFRRVRENLPYWSEQLPEIPSLVYDVLRLSKQTQEINHSAAAHFAGKKHSHDASSMKRVFLFGVGAALLVSSLVFYVKGTEHFIWIQSIIGAAFVLLAA